MRQIICWFLLFSGAEILRAQGFSPVQDAGPTVPQILEKVTAALGGREKAGTLTSLHMSGSLELVNVALQGTVEIVYQAPDRRSLRWTLPGLGVIRNACDGRQGWSEALLGGRMPVTGERLQGMQRRARLLQVFQLSQLYPRLTLLESERLADRDCWIILAEPPAGRAERWYFETSSGLPRRVDCYAEDGLPLEIEMEDYREVGGMRFPFLVRQFTPVYHIVMRFHTIRPNLPADTSSSAGP